MEMDHLVLVWLAPMPQWLQECPKTLPQFRLSHDTFWHIVAWYNYNKLK